MQSVCPKCHRSFPAGSKFCGFCGVPLPAPPVLAEPPQPGAAGETMVFAGLRKPSIEARILEKKPDGTWGNPRQVAGEVSIGRAGCEVAFPDDALLSDRHALLSKHEGKLFLKDFGSLNGTFVRQRQDSELVPGDIFLAGRALFRFTTRNPSEAGYAESAPGTLAWPGPSAWQQGPVAAKLEHIKLTGEVIEEFALEKPETTLGRARGDLIFKDDPYMSGTHARIVAREGHFVLQDLRSRNGVFRRVRRETELVNGDEFFLGERVFRVEIKVLS